jgi:hypothetical protein
MKTRLCAVILLLTVVCAGIAAAVPPTYTGQFGNPEEPALRPIKWAWVGVKSLVQSTKDGLASGVEKDPASMVGEGAVGAVKGTGSLVLSVHRGIVGAPLPPRRDAKSLPYEEAAMVVINNGTGKDACCPQQCGNCGSDQEAAKKPDPGAEFRKPAPSTVLAPEAEAGPGAKPLVSEESNVEKAQRNYVPVQAGYRSDRHSDASGNLLKRAK